MEILYRVNDEALAAVFGIKDVAEHVARIHSALNSAKTWREFAELIGPDEFRFIVEDRLDESVGSIDPDAPFNPIEVPGYQDGDYPTWLQAEMLEWMPAEIAMKYGKVEMTALSGDFLEIQPEHVELVADALREAGHTVTRTDLHLH